MQSRSVRRRQELKPNHRDKGTILVPPRYSQHRTRPRRRLLNPCFKMISRRQILSAVLIVGTFAYILRKRSRLNLPPHVQDNLALYESAYGSPSVLDPEALPYPRDVYNFLVEYEVEECPITVVFMDPRPANLPASSSSAWRFALESVGAVEPDACIVVMTSTSCQEATENIEPIDAEASARKHIYELALPLLQNMMNSGRVRISFLDWELYGLKSCADFGNPTPALLSRDFWVDEFVEADSDLVLIIQDDSVLCREIPASFRQYSFVGAVWPRTPTKQMPFPPTGMCDGMKSYWKSWLRPQLRWERWVERGQPGKEVPVPNHLIQDTEFPDVCSHGRAPLGNGGLSLRSRSWLIKAIEACPHVKYNTESSVAGIETSPCRVVEQVNEDFYFGVILNGLRAPLPNSSIAALFSVEMLWPHEVAEMYDEEDHKSRGFPMVPVGMHKPWWYLSNKALEQLNEECPYLKYIFKPEDSRYAESDEAS